MPNSSTREAPRITEARALAAAKSYSSRRMLTSSEMISVSNGMLPAIKITAPYSPRLRVNARAVPVSSAGISCASTTRKNDAMGVAPRVAAASSTSGVRSSSTGCTARTTNGRLVKLIAIMMPSGV